ncbi:MAG: pseudouridine synthase [Blastocatellia bacterium]
MESELIRLSKLMAQRGLCSRREADDYIARGLVRVNGEVMATLGEKVRPDVAITLAPAARRRQEGLVTILLNKPVGYVSAQPEPPYQPAITLITPGNQFIDERDRREYQQPLRPEHKRGLAVAGRLDIDSQGLLLLTQDGRMARHVIGENSGIEKEYIVRVSGALPAERMALLRHGLSLDDKPLKPARVEWINDDQLRFVLKEGRKRQIRRMCELVGLRIHGLKRVRIGQLRLGNLPEGMWRFLGADEAV